MTVDSFQEAMTLYSTSKTECRQCERTLQDAVDKMHWAMWRVRIARTRLTDAEFRVGKARYIIRKRGYGQVLRVRSGVDGRDGMSSSNSKSQQLESDPTQERVTLLLPGWPEKLTL